MTNAEKYLKDEVSVEELIATMEKELPFSYVDLAQFWKKTIKPTLTEDERVILRNIKKDYTIVARDKAGTLFIATEFDEKGVRGHIALEFNRCLFQFIKNGEEYLIEELLKGE